MGNTELQRFIDNKSLIALKKFAEAEAQLKEMKANHDKVIDKIMNAMKESGVTKLEGDWGYITLAERTSYKADNIAELDEKYTKPTLDTAKVKAEVVLTGVLPEGITETKTEYITKKFKD